MAIRRLCFVFTFLLLCLPLNLQAEKAEANLQKYMPGVKHIILPDRASVDALIQKTPQYKYIVDWTYTKKNWAKVFKQVHERIGLFYKEGVPMKLHFSQKKNAPPAFVMARAGEGSMTINFPAFHQEVKSFPSIGIFGLIAHEFTHVVQFNKGGNAPKAWPSWMVEGMGTYVTDVEDKYIALWAQKEQPHTLDQPIKNVQDALYAWGSLFHSYLADKYGEKKLFKFIDLIINNKMDYKKAAEQVTKKKWSQLMDEELRWKVNWIKTYHQQKKK